VRRELAHEPHLISFDPAPRHRGGPRGLTLSSIAIGTYLGDDTDSDDAAYTETVRLAFADGINVGDGSINYRCQRSERAIGRALNGALVSGEVARDEVVVCTKGGYVPLDGYPPATPEGYQGYLRREFYARNVMEPKDVVSGGHCLTRGFLVDCLARSRANLGVDVVDVYYVHNPEQQLAAVGYDELLDRLRTAFATLEECVERGEIGVYGCATWHGLRVERGARGHICLADLVHRRQPRAARTREQGALPSECGRGRLTVSGTRP
jgi:aryl-alcohol dehydrogenase-like predicted oxidoreductase